MPENEEQDVLVGVQTPAETALEKFEREQLTRRQALKKFGITSAMATFALFSVDDLAHMVGKAMQQRTADNKVAEQVAKELQQAGIALASGPNPYPCSGPPSTCQHCANQLNLDDCYCISTYGGGPDGNLFDHCANQAAKNFKQCSNCWCGTTTPPSNNVCPPPSSRQPPAGCGC